MFCVYLLKNVYTWTFSDVVFLEFLIILCVYMYVCEHEDRGV